MDTGRYSFTPALTRKGSGASVRWLFVDAVAGFIEPVHPSHRVTLPFATKQAY